MPRDDTPRRRAAPGEGGLRTAVGHLGDRWSLLIVDGLLGGPRRFNELAEALGDIAPNVLSQRLRQLERDGLVLALPYSTRPPRYAYQLTASGAALVGVMRLLAHWGAEHAGGDGASPLVHEACGTPAEPRWWCPTCERTLDDAELDVVTWV